MAKIAVMGHGVVGSGVVEITLVNGEQLKKRSGETIEVKRILDLRDFPGHEAIAIFLQKTSRTL